MFIWNRVEPLGGIEASIMSFASSSNGSYVYVLHNVNPKGRLFTSVSGAWWVELFPSAPPSGFPDAKVKCSRSGQHVIVWSSGSIAISHDYGATWSAGIYYGNWAERSISGAAISDDGQIIAIVGRSRLSSESYRRAFRSISSNGGSSFTITRGTTLGEGDVAMSSSGDIIITTGASNESGTDPGVWRSSNSGSSFTKISTVTCRSACINSAGNIFYYTATASGGVLYKSTDGGAGSLVSTPSLGQYARVATDDTGNIVLLGTGNGVNVNKVRYSDNGGTGFSEESPDGISDGTWGEHDVTVSGNGMIMSVINRPSIAVLYYDTYTTASQPLPPSQAWSSVSMSNDGAVMAVATATGSVYLSSDFGKTWNKAQLPE